MEQDPLSLVLAPEIKARIRTLDEPYMAALRWAEELACNRPGQDKSWVTRIAENHRRYFSEVRLVPRE
jgi:hypothetical protein